MTPQVNIAWLQSWLSLSTKDFQGFHPGYRDVHPGSLLLRHIQGHARSEEVEPCSTPARSARPGNCTDTFFLLLLPIMLEFARCGIFLCLVPMSIAIG